MPRISLVISLILAFGLSASAVARNSDLDACADSAQGSFMEADVRVLRKGLQIVEGLKPANFAVTLGGVPKQVCKVERSSSPLSIGILLDVSGSMVGKKSDLFGNTAAAVRKLIDSSGAQDEYFLEYITASPGPVPRFTSDLSKIRAGLVYKPKGRTALIDAIYLALAATKDARYSRRALVILSDGMDNGSSRNWEDLHREFDDASVPIFLLVPFESWSGPTAGPIEWSMRKRLVDFVDESGGICAAATGSREIAEKMASLAALVRQPYSLVLPGPQQSVSQHAHLDLRIDVIGLKAPALPLYRSVRVRQVPAGQDRDR